MLGKRGPPYSTLIHSVDESGFEQTDVNNSKIVRRPHICGFAMMHVTLQLQSQRVVFFWGGGGGAVEKPDYY